MTRKEKEYWNLSKQLNKSKISTSDFEYMLSVRNISNEDAKRYECYNTINWIFGMVVFCSVLYYLFIR